MSESLIQKKCRLKLAELGAKMFRVNVGRGWTGDKVMKLKNGDILIKNPRPFHAGVPAGYPDLTGWITRNGVAVFVAAEVKTPTGRISPAQQNFLELLKSQGGISGVVRCESDCEILMGGK